MIRNTRQVSVCVNSSRRGDSSNCSSCVTRAPARFFSLPLVFAIGQWSVVSGQWSVKTVLLTDHCPPTTDHCSSKCHDVVAAVHVEDFAGDGGGERATEEEGDVANLARFDVATQGRTVGVVLEHCGEIADAACGERADGAGADG